MSKYTKFCKLRVIFQAINTFKNYFCFKHFVPKTLRTSVIYKFLYGNYTASYIGKVRDLEYQGVSLRTGKPVKGPFHPL